MAILKRFAVAAGILFGLVLSAGLLAAIGDGGHLVTTKQAAARRNVVSTRHHRDR